MKSVLPQINFTEVLRLMRVRYTAAPGDLGYDGGADIVAAARHDHPRR
jgi:hypothetical protein